MSDTDSVGGNPTVSAQDSSLAAISGPLSPEGLVRSLSDQSLSSVNTEFADECLQDGIPEGALPEIDLYADEDPSIFPAAEQMAVDPSPEVLTATIPAGGEIRPPDQILPLPSGPDSGRVSTDGFSFAPLSVVDPPLVGQSQLVAPLSPVTGPDGPVTATVLPEGPASGITDKRASGPASTVAAPPPFPLASLARYVIPRSTLPDLQVSIERVDAKKTKSGRSVVPAAATSWAESVSASSRESSRDPSPQDGYPPASVRGPLRSGRASRIPTGSARRPSQMAQSHPGCAKAPTSGATPVAPEAPVPASPQGRGSRRKTSPPEGLRSSKKHKRNAEPQFPAGVLEDRSANFSQNAPSGSLGYQGRAFMHHFNTDRQGMRTEHHGRVAPFHAAYQSVPTLSDGQIAAIVALCQLTDGIFICHFCPDEIGEYSAYTDSPLRPDNIYDSAQELHEHVCLYHYPFVHGYDCAFCSSTVASFATWSQLGAHLQRCHDGLAIEGQSQTGAELADRLDYPEGRAVHRRSARPMFNDKFIPPRRLPRSFVHGHVSRALHAYAWGPWLILLKSVQCVPDLTTYHTRFLTYSRGAKQYKWAYASISDRPTHQSVDSVARLSAAEVALLPSTILARTSAVRSSAERAASSYANTVSSAASFAQVASLPVDTQPVQVTPSRGASADTTPERGPSRAGFDLRDTLSRAVLTDRSLKVALACAMDERSVILSDAPSMAPPPSPAPASFRAVSPVPATVPREVPAGVAPYIPLRALCLTNVTLYQGTTCRSAVAEHYYNSAAWDASSTMVSALDRADFMRLKTARTLLRSLDVMRPPLEGPASNVGLRPTVCTSAAPVAGTGSRPKTRPLVAAPAVAVVVPSGPLVTPAVIPTVSDVSMRSMDTSDSSLPCPWQAHFDAFRSASMESCPADVPSAMRDVQYRLWARMEAQGESEVYGPHRDGYMASRPLLTNAQTFRQAMTRLCREIGDEDIFTYAPQAPPGAYLRGISADISASLCELSQASSLVNAQLATQTSLEAAQSLARSPNSSIFRHHAEIFGCTPLSESANLQRRLATAERELAALRAQPATASNPLGPSPSAFVEACRPQMAKLSPARAGELARVLLFACLDQDIQAPDWLLELSRNRD